MLPLLYLSASVDRKELAMELVAPRKRVWWNCKILLAIVLLSVLVLLMPNIKVVASELGGYVSEKLIARSGVSNSQLIIGREGVGNSLLDIVLGDVGGHINPSAPVAPLINTWIVAFAVLAIYTFVRGFLGGVTVKEIVFAVAFIYVLTALMPGLQIAITRLFVGG